MRKDFHGHPSITPQLGGFGAPKPTETSAEDPLIQGSMRTFPDNHPSFGSVRNQTAMGCPAIIYDQMGSDQWKTTYQATINNREPTLARSKEKQSGIPGREGKKQVPALAAADELLVPPRPVLVIPEARRPLGP